VQVFRTAMLTHIVMRVKAAAQVVVVSSAIPSFDFWNLLSLNSFLVVPAQSKDYFVLTNSSALILAFVYLTSMNPAFGLPAPDLTLFIY